MSSAISVPVIIAISSGAGLVVIASTAVVIFLAVHRRRSNRIGKAQLNVATATRTERPLDVRASYEIGESPRSKRPTHPLFRAFSEKTFKASSKSIKDDPTTPRVRNVLQRKRYADGRSSSLPVFSIVAPRIPSPTLSLGRQSSLFEDGESYMLSPITDSNTATAGGSCTSLADQWPLPAQGSGILQHDPLRPAPLFHGHSRSLSGHQIPSAHPPRTTSNFKPSMAPQSQPRFHEDQTLKRFTSLQQIGRAPTGALPTPPPGYIPSFRDGKSQRMHSQSPRPRSMESLISGTSSILRSANSPVTGRKRSATDASHLIPATGTTEGKAGIESRSSVPRNARQFASRTSSRSSRDTKPLPRTAPSGGGSADESLLPRNKSSALSVALMNTIPPTKEESEHEASPKKARHSQASKKKDHNEAPAVLNPSPKRFIRGYRLLQDPEAAASAPLFKEAEPPSRGSNSRELYTSKDVARQSGSRSGKPFVSHLPRSPRPEDRPVGVRLAPRSHTGSKRDSPVQRVLPPGAEPGKLVASNSESSLQSTPPPSRLRQSGLGDPKIAPRAMEPIACGDLASHLRRMDSYCDADDDAGYFNLTGGTCTSPHEVASPRSDKSAHRDRRGLPESSPGTPVRGLDTRTSEFYTPVSLPGELSATQSPPLSLDQAPSLTPNNSSSPHPDDLWVKGSSPRSVGGLGLGLAGQFNITATGLSFSPAGSPCPTPSPSPPPHSALRNTLLTDMNDPLTDGILTEHPVGLQKLDAGRAREFGVIGNNEAVPSLRRREEPWAFRGLLAAREAEERSAELSRDMQLAAQKSRRDLHESGYPMEYRDRRSLRAPSPEELPGMAF